MGKMIMKITTNVKPAVKRENIKLIRDTSRVIARPLIFEDTSRFPRIIERILRVIARTLIFEDTSRVPRIIERILRLSDAHAAELLEKVQSDFSHRHHNIKSIVLRHFDEVAHYAPTTVPINDIKKMLIGSYFTMEYSIESAALFNPSIVPHPDQTNLPTGSLRFIMSLRATGEGHISSIVFRSGVIDKDNSIKIDEKSKFAETPEVRREALIGDSNYTIQFRPDQNISERVIFPVLKNESKGIEDARFVRFVDDNNDVTYYATYTAYDGFVILPQLIETKDFLTFNIITLKGKAVQNKGMALFPRKIDGKYVMLSRQDGETNKIMFSSNLHVWKEAELIQEPASPWEFIQIGNCGSPLETKNGWLVLTHGVGPMRQYSIGAILLDLANPKKVIARLEKPLLMPNEEEREGYVPNVVYSCGSLIHHSTLILPYAMSDITSGVATVDVNELIGCMKSLVI
jgi:predicted GH43/DUF377 family glycosyl hydrolase